MGDPVRFPLVIPPAAEAAYASAHAGGFGADGPTLSSRPGTGALLAVLAASRVGGRLAELGTGLGAGASWIAHGMDSTARLITVEADEGRAAESRARLAHDERVEVLTGRWEDVLPARGPFDFVYVDSGYSALLHEPGPAAFLLDLVVPGGLLVLDDITPELETKRDGTDSKRQFALRHPGVIGAELYPPSLDGVLGGPRSGLLVIAKR